MDRLNKYFRYLLMIPLAFTLFGCTPEKTNYQTFADYPGFEEYYRGRCPKGEPLPSTGEVDRALLYKYRPRLILPPGGNYPIDFYRDYLPDTLMRSYADKIVVAEEVTPEILKMNQDNQRVYLDLQLDRYPLAGLDRKLPKEAPQKSDPEKKPAVYGRVYREIVEFRKGKDERVSRDLTFLKYNVVFALSGLPASLPRGYETLLRLIGLDPDDWHQLDNFVAVHVVLDGKEGPIAAILAQHNHHRTYLIGKDIDLPADGRMVFDIALRSNEVYLDSNDAGPVKHRVIPWVLYLKYLLSGEDPPLFRGYDLTYGVRAGGREISYDLAFLPPCDPFYTAKMMLGEPRPFFGRNIGRDGPPGADYYDIPSLLPLGNLLKFSYLHDGDPDDIAMVSRAIDRERKEIDIPKIREYGGARFYHDLTVVQGAAREQSKD